MFLRQEKLRILCSVMLRLLITSTTPSDRIHASPSIHGQHRLELTQYRIDLMQKAFRDYDTIEDLLALEPSEGEMVNLQWRDSILDQPFFKSMSSRRTPGRIETAGALDPRGRPAMLSPECLQPRQIPYARTRPPRNESFETHTLRSPTGLMALRDMITLCEADTEVG